MTETPAISVVMAVYNGEPFLRETLEAVRTQTFTDWECVVINDCSTDNTLAILNEYAELDTRFKITSNEVNLRLAKSLNRGLDSAKGKYIARLDADDLLLPNRLEKQYAFMEAHPELAVSFALHYTLKDGVLMTGSGGRLADPDTIAAMCLFFCPVLHPGVIAKREVMLRYHYDSAYTCSEDMELWTRMIAAGEKIGLQNEYLCIYRLHGGQITANTKAKAKVEVADILRRYYKQMLDWEDDAFLDSYMNNAYFHEHDDLTMLADVYRAVKQANRKKAVFTDRQLLLAMLEVISEAKHVHGIPKRQLPKLLCFGGLGFLKEYRQRKQRTLQDFERSIPAAEQAGYVLIEKANGIVPTFGKEV